MDLLGCDAVYSGKVHQRFGGKYCFHLQDRKISKARNKHGSACRLLHASFLLGLFFDFEDGGDMLLRNAGRSPSQTVLQPGSS
jgi:hypothetical protein